MANPQIGFHASHEQFRPGELLDLVRRADAAGFEGAMCSDHFAPWSVRQGQSGSAWPWLGAALASTSLTMGTVTAPGARYHPAVVAQSAATLAEMFPDRLWLALGSGEALNESITGLPWPDKNRRNARLRECVDVIRALFRGETVTHHGEIVVRSAKLWTLPDRPPLLFGAAVTPETARWVAGWADGLITVTQPPDRMRATVEAFREGGGEHKPMSLQVHLSHAATREQAVAEAMDQWRTNVFDSAVLADLPSTAAFDAAAISVEPSQVCRAVRVSSDLGEHVAWLAEDIELGFERIFLHHVGRDQARFIDAFGSRVLPELRDRVPAPMVPA